MFGRAGRNGYSARAHLLHTNTQMKHISDSWPFLSVGNKENCFRLGLLRALSSKETVRVNAACCSVCTAGKVPDAKLDLLAASTIRPNKKPKTVRLINADMEEALCKAFLKERDRIMDECPGYKMCGSSFILSTSTIKKLCSMAHYITSKDELKEALSLRPELYDRIFNVLQNTFACAPTHTPHQRQ